MSKSYYEKNKAKVIARSKLWAANNRERRNRNLATYRERNRARIRKQHQEWYERNKREPWFREDRKRFNASWLERNREYRREYARQLRKKNIEKVRKNKRLEKLRLLANPRTRMELNLRQRVRMALKAQGARKTGKTFDLVGMSGKELRSHLEGQFKDGMSWENYGKWHIDHKRPCASFNLIDPAEQKLAFHYSNLQPLWAKDNLVKSSKYAKSL